MPTPDLRERVREALSVHLPDDASARADLDAALAKTRPRRYPRRWVIALVPAVAAVALLVTSSRRPLRPVAPAASSELDVDLAIAVDRGRRDRVGREREAEGESGCKRGDAHDHRPSLVAISKASARS